MSAHPRNDCCLVTCLWPVPDGWSVRAILCILTSFPLLLLPILLLQLEATFPSNPLRMPFYLVPSYFWRSSCTQQHQHNHFIIVMCFQSRCLLCLPHLFVIVCFFLCLAILIIEDHSCRLPPVSVPPRAPSAVCQGLYRCLTTVVPSPPYPLGPLRCSPNSLSVMMIMMIMMIIIVIFIIIIIIIIMSKNNIMHIKRMPRHVDRPTLEISVQIYNLLSFQSYPQHPKVAAQRRRGMWEHLPRSLVMREVVAPMEKLLQLSLQPSVLIVVHNVPCRIKGSASTYPVTRKCPLPSLLQKDISSRQCSLQ